MAVVRRYFFFNYMLFCTLLARRAEGSRHASTSFIPIANDCRGEYATSLRVYILNLYVYVLRRAQPHQPESRRKSSCQKKVTALPRCSKTEYTAGSRRLQASPRYDRSRVRFFVPARFEPPGARLAISLVKFRKFRRADCFRTPGTFNTSLK